MPKILEHFSWTFDYLRLFLSARGKNSVKKSNTFSEANTTEFHAVLSHYAKCRDLCVKVLRNYPKLFSFKIILAYYLFPQFFYLFIPFLLLIYKPLLFRERPEGRKTALAGASIFTSQVLQAWFTQNMNQIWTFYYLPHPTHKQTITNFSSPLTMPYKDDNYNYQ